MCVKTGEFLFDPFFDVSVLEAAVPGDGAAASLTGARQTEGETAGSFTKWETAGV